MEHEPHTSPAGPVNPYWPPQTPAPEPAPVLYNKFMQAGQDGRNKFGFYLATAALAMGGYILGQIPFLFIAVMAIKNKYVSITDPDINSKLLNPEVIHQPPWLVLALTLFIFVVAMAGLWIGVVKVHRKKFLRIVTGHTKFRRERFITGFAVWGGLMAVMLAINMALKPADVVYTFSAKDFIPSFLVAVLLLPVQTWFEEFFMRGNLLQGFAQATKSPVWGIIITSLLFAGMHMFNPEAAKYGRLAVLPQYLLPAILFGVITVLDEGLELAMGMHFINNLFGAVVITSSDSAIQSSTIWRSVGEMNMAAENISYLIVMTVVIAFLWWRYKWKTDKLYRWQ
jgi:uncharacterized protein